MTKSQLERYLKSGRSGKMKSYEEYKNGFNEDPELIARFGSRNLAIDYWITLHFFKDIGITDLLSDDEASQETMMNALKNNYGDLERMWFITSFDNALSKLEKELKKTT